MSSRADALAALAMYSAVRPRAALAQMVARMGIALFGARILPGKASPWLRPMDDATWAALDQAWRKDLGEYDAIAIYERGHVNRPGSAILLLRGGEPLAFVKVRCTDTASLQNEGQALEEVWRARPRSFSVAQPLGSGAVAGWYYLAMAPMAPHQHRVPSVAPLHAILEELRAALCAHPKPEGMPSHWEPMHGDFTPWNLREMPSGKLMLVDWEYAGWGPPGADEMLYRASHAAVTGRDTGPADRHEAIQFWSDRMRAWPVTVDRDGRLVQAVLQAFARMDAAGR